MRKLAVLAFALAALGTVAALHTSLHAGGPPEPQVTPQAGAETPDFVVPVPPQPPSYFFLHRCPTPDEIASVNSRVIFSFEAPDPSEPYGLVCTAAGGSADLTRLELAAYRAILAMEQITFTKPLPWTSQRLDLWFTSRIAGLRFRDDIDYSSCCNPPGWILVKVDSQLAAVAWEPTSWISVDLLMALLIHEARHVDLPHTCDWMEGVGFVGDQTMEEMGSWGVQYWLNRRLGESTWLTAAERDWDLSGAKGICVDPSPRFCTGTCPPYDLTIHADGAGTGTVTTLGGITPALHCTVQAGHLTGVCQDSYPDGQTITLFAAPNAASTFGGWTSCQNPIGDRCVVTMAYRPENPRVTFNLLPAPAITSVAPARGLTAGGTTVTVVGQGFVPGSTTVKIDGMNGVSVGDLTVTDTEHLTFVTPPHPPGQVSLWVETPSGTLTRVSAFRYVRAAAGLPLDFNGDLWNEPSVYRPATGEWFVKNPRLTLPGSPVYFGSPGDQPVRGDFDGDGKRDIAVYRPATGTWFWLKSSKDSTEEAYKGWGVQGQGDVPAPGDFDGDGKTDPTVYRPKYGTWFILRSESNYGSHSVLGWGGPGDQPVPGDYDGDGTSDIAVYRASTGEWFVLKSGSGFSPASAYPVKFGQEGDVPVRGDFDGDGRQDIAVYRPSTGTWFWLKSSAANAQYDARGWGMQARGDVPVPGDYDGDGRTDLCVYRPQFGTWFILWSEAGYTTYSTYGWGVATDVPLGGAK